MEFSPRRIGGSSHELSILLGNDNILPSGQKEHPMVIPHKCISCDDPVEHLHEVCCESLWCFVCEMCRPYFIFYKCPICKSVTKEYDSRLLENAHEDSLCNACVVRIVQCFLCNDEFVSPTGESICSECNDMLDYYRI